ncbi:peptidyl-prolyl cis-trans isomerase [Acetobacteraceae bacterium H6797]|nr:peptidyl-prolyl cis-trans isomerase [Acetobacteraceae bacterium H6797]
MITAFRRLAGTWFSKVLFILLILSFGIWGIEDVVRNMWQDNAVVRMTDGKIELPEAQVAARRQLSQLQRQLGPRFEVTPQMREAVASQAVEGLVMERAFSAEAVRLGLVTPDTAVRDYIWAIPAFHGPDGRFSRLQFDSFLRSNDLNEAEVMRLAASGLLRQQLAGAVLAGAAAPDALVNPLLAWRDEKRTADVVELPFLSAADPAPPTDEQLRRFHENNPDRFSAPEYREATIAVLSPELLLPEVALDDAALREAYEQRRGQLGQPEKREVEQVLVSDEAKAREIAAAWKTDTAFADIEAKAKEAGGQATSLGSVDRNGLPLPELAEAAFSLEAGGTSAPVQSPFGWHVLHVSKIEAGNTPSFESVKDQLQRELGLEKASDLAFERSNKIEDALAGGATLAEAAKQFGMRAETVTIDANGLGADGRPVSIPVSGQQRSEILRRVFTTATGVPPHLDEIEGGAMIAVEVSKITPPALKPFETVEADVRRVWTNDQRRHEQEVKAAALLAAVKAGKPLADAAKEAGLEAVRRENITRQPPQNAAPGTAVPPQLVAPIFGLADKDVTMAETPDGFAVAQLVAVVPHDPSNDPLGRGQVRAEVTQEMQSDIEQQFAIAMRAKADPRVNPAMLRQVLGGQ